MILKNKTLLRSSLFKLLSAIAISLLGTAPISATALIQRRDTSAHTLTNETKPKEDWIGMYLSGRKIGYSSIFTSSTIYHGKIAQLIRSHGMTHLQVLGSSVDQEDETTTISDSNQLPLEQTFDVKSNGSAIHVEAVFDHIHHKIQCKIGSGSSQTNKELFIPAEAHLAGDTNALTAGRKLKIGDKLEFSYLEPLSVELQKAKIEVTGEAKLRDPLTGTPVNTLIVKASLTLGQMTSWESEAGNTIKSEIDLGVAKLIMVRDTKKNALLSDSLIPRFELSTGVNQDIVPPVSADFAIATAIIPDKIIPNPRTLKILELHITGIPKERIISDGVRQFEKAVDETDINSPIEVLIEVPIFSEEDSALTSSEDENVARYLKKTDYLNIDDPQIRETASQLRGKTRNLYSIAVSIRNWVHKVMVPDPSIGVPRSATDIYGRRRGVCRDYATLFTAVARSAGVPTRLCSGIVYAQDRFFYHAWAECWVGKWIAFDPTLYDPKNPVEFVDATHIKFAEGDVTSMFDVVSIVGRLKLKVDRF